MGRDMNALDLRSFFILTLRAPREAGEQFLAMQLPARAMWIALSLVSVLTSLGFSGLMYLGQGADDQFAQMFGQSPVYSAPLVFAAMQWVRAILSVFMFYWVGRMMGGQGALEDVLRVATLLQAVTFVLMSGLLLAGIVLPFVMSLLILVTFFWWIRAKALLLALVHGFDSVFKAAGALLLSMLGVTIGVSFFFGAIANLFLGVS